MADCLTCSFLSEGGCVNFVDGDRLFVIHVLFGLQSTKESVSNSDGKRKERFAEKEEL